MIATITKMIAIFFISFFFKNKKNRPKSRFYIWVSLNYAKLETATKTPIIIKRYNDNTTITVIPKNL